MNEAERRASGAADSWSAAEAIGGRLHAVVRLGVPREPQVRDSQHWPVRVPLAPTRGLLQALGTPSPLALLRWSVAFLTLPHPTPPPAPI